MTQNELHCQLSINTKNDKNQTPLHIAYKNGYGAGIDLLERAGASQCIKDNMGKRPKDYSKEGQDQDTSRASFFNTIGIY